MSGEERDLLIPFDLAGQRLDQALAQLLPHYSRSRIAQWIRNGNISAPGQRLRPKDRVTGGERILFADALRSGGSIDEESHAGWLAGDDSRLLVVHEDEHLIVVDKPASLVVHPGAGTPDHTLANALLTRYPEVARIPRAGLVHRLDKDTTGLLAVARSLRAHTRLVADIADRRVGREYEAVVAGTINGAGTIDAPIGRHRTARTRMAVRPDGRHAVTHFRVLHQFHRHTHLRVRLETGRTHQIRVHFRHIGHPIVGDPVYGQKDVSGPVECVLERQALHAATLALEHPVSGQSMRFDSTLPEDFRELLERLKATDTGRLRPEPPSEPASESPSDPSSETSR